MAADAATSRVEVSGSAVPPTTCSPIFET